MANTTVNCWEWLFSGNAIFHVHNANGVEFVYKIVRAELDCNCDSNPHCANCGGTGKSHRHFASLIRNNHPALEGKYGYIGEVTPNAPRIRSTTKSRWSEDSIPFKTLLWALKNAHGKKPWPEGYGLTTRRCGYCGEQVREQYTDDYSYCVGGCKPVETKEKPVEKKPTEKKGKPKNEPACACGTPSEALTQAEAEKYAEGINFFGSEKFTAVAQDGVLILCKDHLEIERAVTHTHAATIYERICN